MPKISILNRIAPAQPTSSASRLSLTGCIPTTVSRAAEWGLHVKPQIEQRYVPNQYRKIPTFSSANLAFARDTYFGEFCDFDIPEGVVIPFEYKWRPESKFKTFKNARESGAIVLNPMLAYRGYRNNGVGFWAGEGTPMTSQPVLHSDTDCLGGGWGPTGCPNYPKGRLYGEGYITGTEGASKLSTTYHYDVWSVPIVRTALSVDSEQALFARLVSDLDNMEIEPHLVTRARAEANTALLDVSTTLAEAPELISSILRTIELILAKYLEVRGKIKVLKRNKINSADTVSQIADLWLQYRYAIMPNVYTISDTIEYLASVTVSYQSVRNGEHYTFEPPSFDGWEAEHVDMLNRCFIKNRFDMAITKAKQYLGTNLFGTAYELVPLSFVLDWVLNVGDLITAISGPSGSIQEGGLYSWKASHQFAYKHPDWKGSPYLVDIEYYKATTIDPASNLGLSPQFNVNWKRWMDALALSWGFTKGSFKQQLRKLR